MLPQRTEVIHLGRRLLGHTVVAILLIGCLQLTSTVLFKLIDSKLLAKLDLSEYFQVLNGSVSFGSSWSHTITNALVGLVLLGYLINAINELVPVIASALGFHNNEKH